jgi:hypothetical protein
VTPVRPAADPGMLLLGALVTGATLDTSTGELRVLVPGCPPEAVPADVITDLEDRGWLDLSGPAPAVTDRGLYWLDRWAHTHHRRR